MLTPNLATVNNRFIRYSIDHLNSEHITGWCFNRIRKSKPVKLSFLLDDVTIGTAVADNYREDLKSYQLHPDGRCGFDFRFPGNHQFRDHARLSIHAGKARVPFETFEIKQIPRVLDGELVGAPASSERRPKSTFGIDSRTNRAPMRP